MPAVLQLSIDETYDKIGDFAAAMIAVDGTLSSKLLSASAKYTAVDLIQTLLTRALNLSLNYTTNPDVSEVTIHIVEHDTLRTYEISTNDDGKLTMYVTQDGNTERIDLPAVTMAATLEFLVKTYKPTDDLRTAYFSDDEIGYNELTVQYAILIFLAHLIDAKLSLLSRFNDDSNTKTRSSNKLVKILVSATLGLCTAVGFAYNPLAGIALSAVTTLAILKL